MDLTPLLDGWSCFREAGPADNDALLRYFEKTSFPSEGGFVIRYLRSPDFFRFLGVQSPRFVPLVATGRKGDVKGIISLSVRDSYVGERATPVAYIGDFRMSFDRAVLQQWRDFAGHFMANCAATQRMTDVRYFVAAIVEGNTAAKRAFVEDATLPFTVELLSRYQMVNILGRVSPCDPRLPRSPFTFHRGRPEDTDDVEAFLERQSRGKPLGQVFARGELRRRLKSWGTLTLGDFHIARSDGQIVGCVAPWSPALSKRIALDALPLLFRILGSTGLAKPWVRIPSIGDVLKTLYLTHFELEATLPAAQRSLLAKSLLTLAYRDFRHTDYHVLAFADFPQDSRLHDLSGYLTERLPMGLYVIRHKTTPPPAALFEKAKTRAPYFEIALV